MLCRWYSCQMLCEGGPPVGSQRGIQPYGHASAQNEPSKILPGDVQWEIFRLIVTSKDIHLDPEKTGSFLRSTIGVQISPWWPKKSSCHQEKGFQFYYNATSRTLYRRTPDRLLLRYLSNQKAQEVLKEVHDAICGSHQPNVKLDDRIHMMGYY